MKHLKLKIIAVNQTNKFNNNKHYNGEKKGTLIEGKVKHYNRGVKNYL